MNGRSLARRESYPSTSSERPRARSRSGSPPDRFSHTTPPRRRRPARIPDRGKLRGERQPGAAHAARRRWDPATASFNVHRGPPSASRPGAAVSAVHPGAGIGPPSIPPPAPAARRDDLSALTAPVPTEPYLYVTRLHRDTASSGGLGLDISPRRLDDGRCRSRRRGFSLITPRKRHRQLPPYRGITRRPRYDRDRGRGSLRGRYAPDANYLQRAGRHSDSFGTRPAETPKPSQWTFLTRTHPSPTTTPGLSPRTGSDEHHVLSTTRTSRRADRITGASNPANGTATVVRDPRDRTSPRVPLLQCACPRCPFTYKPSPAGHRTVSLP